MRTLYLIYGASGSGKTTLAKRLLNRDGDNDRLIGNLIDNFRAWDMEQEGARATYTRILLNYDTVAVTAPSLTDFDPLFAILDFIGNDHTVIKVEVSRG